MKYGYVRSNLQEGIEKQIKELSDFNLDKIVEEKNGADLLALLQDLKPEDSLYIVSIDRLTRSLREYTLLSMILELKQVELVEVKKTNNLKTAKDALFALALNNMVKPLADCDEEDE